MTSASWGEGITIPVSASQRLARRKAKHKCRSQSGFVTIPSSLIGPNSLRRASASVVNAARDANDHKHRDYSLGRRGGYAYVALFNHNKQLYHVEGKAFVAGG